MPDLPTPETKPPASRTKSDAALSSLVEIEKLAQIGILIPAATVIGWLIGAGLDHALHRHWLYLVGLILGATAGFVQMFRIVLQNTKE